MCVVCFSVKSKQTWTVSPEICLGFALIELPQAKCLRLSVSMSEQPVIVLADGKAASVNLRVEAIAASNHGNYTEGDHGTVVEVSPDGPIVRWDKSGRSGLTHRRNIKARNLLLADGSAAAIGLRVIAVGASSHGRRYSPGDVGTIVKLNVGDPVILWDKNGEEYQTSRSKVKRMPNIVLSDGQIPVVGLRVVATATSIYGHYREGDEGTITRLTQVDPIVRWNRTGQEQKTPRIQIRGFDCVSLSDGQAAAVGLRVVAIRNDNAGATGVVIKVGPDEVAVRWDKDGKVAPAKPAELKGVSDVVLVDGEIAVVGLRVVALEDSSFGSYHSGDTGTVVQINASDPIIRWDSSGAVAQTDRSKLRASHHFELADGMTAAVGMKVVATTASEEGHHAAGDVGTIVRIDPTNPVVRWENSGAEYLTRRTQLQGVPPPIVPSVDDEAAPSASDAPALPEAAGVEIIKVQQQKCKHAPCCYHVDPDHWRDFNHGIQPQPSPGCKILVLHYGTTEELAERIRAKGFGPSNVQTGTLGRGVYLFRHKEQAVLHGGSSVQVRVRMHKIKRITHKGGLQTSWNKEGYDTAWIPAKNTHIGTGQEEICVWDPAQVTVYEKRLKRYD